MLARSPFSIDRDRARFPGLSFGYGDSDPFIIARTKHFMVLRKKPTTNWSSRGASSSYPAKYWLVEYDKHPKWKDKHVVLEDIEEVEPGHGWKAEQARLIERMNNLEAKW